MVVVKIGYWPNRNKAQRIRDAQQTYCDEDPRAACVPMIDLSRFYHLDATSFLIGGNRIADAYLTLLAEESSVCPGTPTKDPTKMPTQSPIKMPSRNPSQSPITSPPTIQPTKQPTNQHNTTN